MIHSKAKRVLLFGATGTAGRGAAMALVAAGHDVTCVLRPQRIWRDRVNGASIRHADPTAPDTLHAVFAAKRFDAVVSCLASRTGAPQDAWAIDHAAQCHVLSAAKSSGVPHFILLSAICVQRPRLAFQQAKLAFEAALISSGLTYSIVRPTAFFKSLSGQIARLQAGKPFLLFGDGRRTACKPISDADLGRFIASCLTDQDKHNAVLPIGGPGPAITPRDQGDALFEMLDLPPRFRRVPLGMMDAIIAGLTAAGTLSPALRAKAELARIGRYYASESMLHWDAVRARYDPDQTPEYGTDTLFAFYEQIIAGDARMDLGDHAIF